MPTTELSRRIVVTHSEGVEVRPRTRSSRDVDGPLAHAFRRAFANAEMTSIDRATVQPAPSRGPIDDPTLRFEVTTQGDHDVVILVEEDGKLSWLVQPVSTTRTRGLAQTQRFVYEPAARERSVDGVFERIRLWFLEFVARKAASVAARTVVAWYERHQRTGPVLIGGRSLRSWVDADDLASIELPERPANVLLLLHGTFASTRASFGQLVLGAAEEIEAWTNHYDLVVGFDHRTLSESPEANAAGVVAMLRTRSWPFGAELDIVAFSRGGLVARCLVEEALPAAQLPVVVRNVVGVGPANSGTRLAERERWTTLLDTTTNLVAGAGRFVGLLYPGAGSVTVTVEGVMQGLAVFAKALTWATLRSDDVPGLKAMVPNGDLVERLNTGSSPKLAPQTHYRIVASNFEPWAEHGAIADVGFTQKVGHWLLDSVVDPVFSNRPNDLVVDNEASVTLHPELRSRVVVDKVPGRNPRVHHLNFMVAPETRARIGQLAMTPAEGDLLRPSRAPRAAVPPVVGSLPTPTMGADRSRIPTMTLTRPTPMAIARADTLTAGAARIDITPFLGGPLGGHGPTSSEARGLYGRLFASVLVVDDGKGERAAFVTTDLHAGSRWIQERIAQLVAEKTGLGTDRILLAASHTHRGPGSIYGNHTYDRIAGTAILSHWEGHFDQDVADALAERIATAILVAAGRMVPAKIGMGHAPVWGVTWNRSGVGLDGQQEDATTNPDDFLADPRDVPRLRRGEATQLSREMNREVAPPPPVRSPPDPPEPGPSREALEAELREALGADADALFEGLERAVRDELRGAETRSHPDHVMAEVLAEIRDTLDDPDQSWDLALLDASEPGDTIEQLLERTLKAQLLPALKLILPNWFRKFVRRRSQRRRSFDSALVDAHVHTLAAFPRDSDRPIGVFGLIGATSTVVGASHAVYCGDAVQEAAMWLRHRSIQRGDGPYPVGLSGGALGDVNVYPHGVPLKVFRKRATELDWSIDQVRSLGATIGEALGRSIEDARKSARWDLTLTVALREVSAAGATFEVARLPGVTQTLPTEAKFGVSTLRGSDLGRSPLRAVAAEGLLANPDHRDDPHYPKVALPRMEAPPTVLPFRLITFTGADGHRFGVGGVPAEISTALAHQIQASLKTRPGEPDIVLASPAGEFGGYFGTVWEYLSQSYEAASTPWGRWAGEWARTQFEHLIDHGGDPVGPTATFTGQPMPRPRLVHAGKQKGEAKPNRFYKTPQLDKKSVLHRLLDGSGPRATRHDGEILARWRGPRPTGDEAFWQGPLVTLVHETAQGWQPLTLRIVPITDVTTNALVWCEIEEDHAVWLLRWCLPDVLSLPAGVLGLEVASHVIDGPTRIVLT